MRHDSPSQPSRPPAAPSQQQQAGRSSSGSSSGGSSSETNNGSMAARSATSLRYCCEICGQEGLREEEMREHMLVAHIDGAISCPFCDLSEITAQEMFLHVNGAHLDYLSPDQEDAGGYAVAGSGTNGSSDEDHGASNGACGMSEMEASGGGGGRRRSNRNYSGAGSAEIGSGVAGGKQHSPLRSKLSLDLNRQSSAMHNGAAAAAPPLENGERYNQQHHKPNQQSRSSSRVIQCPICQHSESSPRLLEEHINRQHFDLTSPSFPALSPASLDGLGLGVGGPHAFGCPLCARRFQSGSDLELHVNMDHRDILSPAKPAARPAAGLAQPPPGHDENSNQSCPVCGVSGFRGAVDMASHIEDHFERKPTLASPEIVSDVSSDSLLAQEMEKQEHEARKIREQREFELLKAQYGMDNRGSFRDQSLSNMQKAVYAGEMSVDDYYNRQIELKVAESNGVDDGHSCTKGLVPRVRAISTGGNNVLGAWLCTTVDHYGSTYGDKGWGCGYRNIQMLLASLRHHTGYNEKLFRGELSIPSISKIQELIEWAWRKGFDPQGCEQLGGKLCNTRKWIGATEVVTFLSSFRVRCQLVDFHRPTGPDGTHPELFHWVLQYFQRHEEFKPPLYLQHQGHSRTIVGVEQLRDGAVRLLVFDPSHSRSQMELFASTSSATSGMRLIRRPLGAMKARQYQIVAIAGIVETEQEFQQSKILRSVRVPREH